MSVVLRVLLGLSWILLEGSGVKSILKLNSPEVEGSNLYFFPSGYMIVLIVVSTTVYNYRCPGCKNNYKLRGIFELHWRLVWACLRDSFQVHVLWTWRYLSTLTIRAFAGFFKVLFPSLFFTLDKGRTGGDCSCWSWCCKVKAEGCRASPPTQSTTPTPVWICSGWRWSSSPPSWPLVAAVWYSFCSYKYFLYETGYMNGSAL